MTLYSELGVRESASYDEIRAAYLRLAKAQHPDHVQDRRDRPMADEQMSRLNYIMDVLGDTKKRSAYNDELACLRAAADIRVQEALALQQMEAARRGRGAQGSRIRAALFGAAGVAVAGVAAIVFLVGDFGEAPTRQRASGVKSDPAVKPVQRQAPQASPRRAIASSPAAPEAESKVPNPSTFSEASRRLESDAQPSPAAVSSSSRKHKADSPPPLQPAPASDLPRELLLAEARRAVEAAPAPPTPVQTKEGARPAANPIPARPEPARSVNKEADPPPAPTMPTVVAAVPPVRAGPLPTPPPPSPKAEPVQHWKGLWLYKADARREPIGQFKAQVVEMRLQDVNGRVHGTYKAIYSPTEAYLGDVDLLLSALSFGDDWMRGIWSGNRGSYGQFELKKTSGGIEASWWTTKPGNRTSRASGSVLLTENHQ